MVESTCTTNSYTLYSCSCGDSYQEGAKGHTFTTLIVEPSETVNGFTLHQCDCGYSYESDPVASLDGTNGSDDVISDVKVYDYVYNGISLTKLTITTTITGNGTSTEELYFTYDGSSPMTVTYGDDIFYYVTNLQGDVIAILNTDGVAVVTYTYDAWGNILDIDGSMKDDLGVANPFTYRGYVYDTESGLYYLQSRYYDPEVGRFINADALVSTGQEFLGNNMFAYCLNNPIALVDISGTCSCSRDGSVTDFKRLEYGLPPLNCTCNSKIAFDETSISVSKSKDSVKISIKVNVAESKVLSSMDPVELSDYVRKLVTRIEYLADMQLADSQINQLYGELVLHIYGWDTKELHPFDSNCEVANLDIINGKVKDPRGWINAISTLLGNGYVEE